MTPETHLRYICPYHTILMFHRERRAKEIRSRLGVQDSIEKVDEKTASDEKVVKEICQRLNEPKVSSSTRIPHIEVFR